MTKPLIISTNKPLPFRDLSPLEFERLCLWLVEREGYLRPQHLGEAGSEQGRDVVAHKSTDAGEELWYFQCKRYKRIGASTLKSEVDKYNSLAEADPTKRPVGVVFVTNATVSARVRDNVEAYCQEHGYAYDFWARTELDMLVKKHSDIVREFFSAGREPFQPSHLFVCYKRSVGPDRKLAAYLRDFLTDEGHDVFIDTDMQTGEAWLEEIDRQIKASDFLIILLSKESADSEMVQAEVRRAYEHRKLQGRPHILPVRIAYEGLLPYSIEAFLDPLQYVVWRSDADNEHVGRDILAVIEGRLAKRTPIQIRPVAEQVILSEDGHPVADEEALHPPLPEFDPRFLEGLEAPGGAIRLRSKFYVERQADADLKREVVKSGTTTTIRAPRQTGKSSLFVRGVHHARQNGAQVVTLSMQRVGQDYLETPNIFLRYLAEFIVRKLRLDVANVAKLWSGPGGPQDKLTYLMEDYILPESDTPIVLAIDEADRLMYSTTFYKDFFALVRSWHENRALDDRWDQVNIVMVISTEPYLLIDDVNQSPFNVGLRLRLRDFDEHQVRDLNQRHGSPVSASDFPQLMTLLNGHPYLTRKALYALVTERQTWADLTRVAATDHGPFGEHLRRYHWLLRDEPDLKKALKEIIRHGRCPDNVTFLRLLRAGLVKGSEKDCTCRCDLYGMYFEDKL